MFPPKIIYKTIDKSFTYEIPKIKWSRFIGHVFPVQNKQEVDEVLDKVKKQHYQANHNCPAYRIWVQVDTDLFGNIQLTHQELYASDDGEPSSTAAYPMKQILQKENIFDILLVVTRYFGWTKLWIWWLIQAYTEASKQVLQNAKIIEKEITTEIDVTYNYDFISKMNYFIDKYNIKIIDQKFGEEIILKGNINIAWKDLFEKELKELWLL